MHSVVLTEVYFHPTICIFSLKMTVPSQLIMPIHFQGSREIFLKVDISTSISTFNNHFFTGQKLFLLHPTKQCTNICNETAKLLINTLTVLCHRDMDMTLYARQLAFIRRRIRDVHVRLELVPTGRVLLPTFHPAGVMRVVFAEMIPTQVVNFFHVSLSNIYQCVLSDV